MKLPTSICAILLTLTTMIHAEPGGYLFATFKGEHTPMTEQVYFGLSRDGKSWSALNGGEPVLVSELGEKGVRDPYLLRSHDGTKFIMIATDLSIHLNRSWKRAATEGSRSILVWESADLVKWSEPRLVPIAAADAGCTWAPEAIYDEEAGDYLVFWASKTAADNFGKFRIWAARTKDFVTFGEPFVYIDKRYPVIDTTIVKDGNAYYRFTKNESNATIFMETSAKLMGEWTEVPAFTLGKEGGYEGPEIYRIPAATAGEAPGWSLILDHFKKGEGYKVFTASDIASGEFKPGDGFTFPFKFRHGSVLALSKEEVERVAAAYP